MARIQLQHLGRRTGLIFTLVDATNTPVKIGAALEGDESVSFYASDALAVAALTARADVGSTLGIVRPPSPLAPSGLTSTELEVFLIGVLVTSGLLA